MAVLVAAACLLAGPAWAARADRNQPITIDADKPGTVDMLKQVVVFNGNVVITQGTITIRAERAEIREGADGFRAAIAIGGAGQQASFRQKREGLDEYIQGTADRIEYEGRGDVVRFLGRAAVKRLRGSTPADEISGERITYDSTTEVFSVAGSTSPTPPADGASGPGNGRVRVILTPRESAASEPEAPR
ncbi:lipopolysaccharide transport periplasmic protein LptA [Aquincola sp. MAHUQ-54]|uniref:Lipopolysaccharide export system protein LptA n=1 Tax=Aquincola agrisoli TaxID=3119538 RepID=A0AAW9QR10_9BURK